MSCRGGRGGISYRFMVERVVWRCKMGGECIPSLVFSPFFFSFVLHFYVRLILHIYVDT